MFKYGGKNYLSNKLMIDFKSRYENGHDDFKLGPVLGKEESGLGQGECKVETETP
jgi:hypothetical protein